MEANTSSSALLQKSDAHTFQAVEQALYAILERRGIADLKGAEDTFLTLAHNGLLPSESTPYMSFVMYARLLVEFINLCKSGNLICRTVRSRARITRGSSSYAWPCLVESTYRCFDRPALLRPCSC